LKAAVSADALPGLIYRRFNLLSLDVVTGALAGAMLAVKVTGSHPVTAFWFCLASSVWLVYTADHLLDGMKNRNRSESPRHLFHYRFKKTLFISILVLGLSTALLAFTYLPAQLILFGTALGIFVLLYLFITWILGRKGKRYFFKEGIIAIVYVAGIWGGPLVFTGKPPHMETVLIIIAFFFLALNNLLTLSYYEEIKDRKDGHYSFTVVHGKKATLALIMIFFLLISFLFIRAIVNAHSAATTFACFIFFIMGILQLFLVFFKNIFGKKYRYRILGELVFWLPGLILLLP